MIGSIHKHIIRLLAQTIYVQLYEGISFSLEPYLKMIQCQFDLNSLYGKLNLEKDKTMKMVVTLYLLASKISLCRPLKFVYTNVSFMPYL